MLKSNSNLDCFFLITKKNIDKVYKKSDKMHFYKFLASFY